MLLKQYVRERSLEARYEIEDLLLDKKVWVALIGVIIALSKAYGWNISIEVFAAVEILIVCLINALSKDTDR